MMMMLVMKMRRRRKRREKKEEEEENNDVEYLPPSLTSLAGPATYPVIYWNQFVVYQFLFALHTLLGFSLVRDY